MKFAICVKLWQHNFTIATVVKLLTKGLCSESGLPSVDIKSFWTEDYAGQIPNRGLWLAILLLWL